MSLSCCYAGEMHCLDAPFRLMTWANYIMPALASPRVATVRAANKMRPRARENAQGRKLLSVRGREASPRACASSCARTRDCTRFDRRRRCLWILPSTARTCEGGSLQRTAGCKSSSISAKFFDPLPTNFSLRTTCITRYWPVPVLIFPASSLKLPMTLSMNPISVSYRWSAPARLAFTCKIIPTSSVTPCLKRGTLEDLLAKPWLEHPDASEER